MLEYVKDFSQRITLILKVMFSPSLFNLRKLILWIVKVVEK